MALHADARAASARLWEFRGPCLVLTSAGEAVVAHTARPDRRVFCQRNNHVANNLPLRLRQACDILDNVYQLRFFVTKGLGQVHGPLDTARCFEDQSHAGTSLRSTICIVLGCTMLRDRVVSPAIPHRPRSAWWWHPLKLGSNALCRFYLSRLLSCSV